MIGSIRNQHAQTLCTLAQGDESTLQYPLPDHIFGFHGQQSCEKLMKALLSVHNVVYPHTHTLSKLCDLLSIANENLPIAPSLFQRLQPYAVEFRYDMGAAFTAAERVDIQASVVLLREHIVARILALESTP